MSGTAIVRYLLAHNSGLIAQVPAAKIFGGDVPIKTVLPAISVKTISSNKRLTVAMNESAYLTTERVQVTVLTKDYASGKSILRLVDTALPNTRGTVNSFNCDSLLPDMQGPDLFDSDAIVYEQSRDFIIKFN